MSTIGDNIRKFRKEKKLTQKKLAELTGLNEVTIRSYEANKYRPKYDNLKNLACVLGVQPHQLIYDDEDNLTLKNVGYPDGVTVTLSQVLYDAIQNDSKIINSINKYMSKYLEENFDIKDIIEQTVVLNPCNDHDNSIFMHLRSYFVDRFVDYAILYYLECGFYNIPISQDNINKDIAEGLSVLDVLDYEENYKEYEIQIVNMFYSLNKKGVKKVVEFTEMISQIPEYQKKN